MSKDKEIEFDPPIGGGVVVGFDGSSASMGAVAEAANEAVLRGAVLHVLRAWMLSNAASEAGAPHGTVPSLAEIEGAVRASLERAVARAREGHEGLQVVAHCHHGKAAQTLVEASKSADLLVVSRRGQGGFVDLLLGSTADQVIRYAKCSILVVRP
jgi:nucleotide-binding universal stress UspA family protein